MSVFNLDLGGNMKKVFELDFRGRKLTVEHGELAKQADGSVLVRYGDTVILTAVVMGNTPITQDFFISRKAIFSW